MSAGSDKDNTSNAADGVDRGCSEATKAALKGCPFCGGKAEIGEATECGDGAYVVGCTEPMCMASSKVVFASKDDPTRVLVEAWNRRPEQSSLADDEDERGFTPSDYAHTADLLCSDNGAIVRAAASNNINIILAALYRCAAAPDLLEALWRADHTLTAHGKIDGDTDLHSFIREAIALTQPPAKAGEAKQ